MLLLIHMSNSFYAELTQYCRSKLPNEACGFIIGNKQIDTYQALSLLTITNISLEPTMHFAMNPIEALSVIQDKSLFSQVIGIFHSHPSSNAEPSQEDLQTLWHAIPTHWIVSFMELENPVLQIRQIKKASPISSSKLSFVVDQ
jgi:proteasome lid subunit RPN8/RPN11